MPRKKREPAQDVQEAKDKQQVQEGTEHQAGEQIAFDLSEYTETIEQPLNVINLTYSIVRSQIEEAIANALKPIAEDKKIDLDDFLKDFEKWTERYVALEPFLQDEIDKANKSGKFDHVLIIDEIEDFMEVDSTPITSVNGEPFDNPYKEIIEAAIEQCEAFNGVSANTALSFPSAPKHHVMPNSKLANDITAIEIIGAGAYDMIVANATGNHKEITTYTMVTYKEGAVHESKKMSEFDRQVSDAICSIYEEAVKNDEIPAFTVDMVFRAMPGSKDRPSPQQKGAITKSIEKLRSIHVEIDATEEFQVKKIINGNSTFKYDDDWLDLRRMELTTPNTDQTYTLYIVKSIPVILEYSKMVNQMLTLPKEYLNIREVHNNKVMATFPKMTQQRQAIIGYLLRRICVIKRDYKNKKNKQSHTILYDTVFDETDQVRNAKQDTRNKDFCIQCFDYWVAIKAIPGYKEQIKGKSRTGIIITFDN